MHGQEVVSANSNENRKLSRRGRLQRSARVQEEEYTPKKKSKALSKEDENFDFTLDDGDENKSNNNNDDRFLRLESLENNIDTKNGVERPTFSSISPGSFEALDDDEDVAYIDEDVRDRDLHGDLLNWLTLSDAPTQGQNEVDL